MQTDLALRTEPMPDASEAEATQARPRRARRRARSAPGSFLRSVTWVVVAACLLGATICGCHALWRYAEAWSRQQSRFQVAFNEIRHTPIPIWMQADLLADVRRSGAWPDSLNCLDSTLAARLAASFALNPWVREVRGVRVRHPAGVLVELSYREPVATIQTTGGGRVVDRHGVLLPIRQVTNPQHYLVVTGISSTPQGPEGTDWGDLRVQGSAALADYLAAHRRELGIVAIDASRYRGPKPPTGPLYLLTEHGTRVTWGRPPNLTYAGELAADRKLARLVGYVDLNGALDAPAGPYEIDISQWGEPTRRPRR